MATSVDRSSDKFDILVRKLKRNPFFMNAFLRAFADDEFVHTESEVAVAKCERRNHRTAAAVQKSNVPLHKKQLETDLHFIVERDLFCTLESAVKTYEISSLCFHWGFTTHSQRDLETLYDARRAIALLTVDKVKRLSASAVAKNRVLMDLCNFGRRMLRLVRTFASRIATINIASIPAFSYHAVLLFDLLGLYFQAVTAFSLPDLSVPQSSLSKFQVSIVSDLLEKRDSLCRLVAEKCQGALCSTSGQKCKDRKMIRNVLMLQNGEHVMEEYLRLYDHLREIERRLERLENTEAGKEGQTSFPGLTWISQNGSLSEHELPRSVYPLIGMSTSSNCVKPRASILELERYGSIYLAESIRKKDEFESVAVLSVAEDARLEQPFTQDLQAVLGFLRKPLEVRLRIDYVNAVEHAIKVLYSNWASNTLCRCVLFTDASGRPLSTQASKGAKSVLPDFLLYLLKNCNIVFHVICLFPKERSSCADILKEIVREAQWKSQIHYLSVSSFEGMKQCIDEIVGTDYCPLETVMHCGNLHCEINVIPPLVPCSRLEGGMTNAYCFDHLEIIGFLSLDDLACAPVFTRHMMYTNYETKSKGTGSKPNFCSLLHHALLNSNMVAICKIGKDWYANICPYSIEAKTFLALNCFEPGDDPVPWLGSFQAMGLKHQNARAETRPFQLPGIEKPSYGIGTAYTFWMHEYPVKADLQKPLRYLRKLPERQALFYHDLNRLITYSSAIGSQDLILAALQTFDQQNSHIGLSPVQARHFRHICNFIRSNPGEPLPPLGAGETE
uniref:Uncharacterized protein n=1 Tax=Trichuris muris TaxID=70415 RepID=A0A5S6QQJ4_TRIMR